MFDIHYCETYIMRHETIFFYDSDSRELRTILQLLQIEEFLTLPMGYKLLLWSVSAKACGAFFRNAKILLFSIFPVWCSGVLANHSSRETVLKQLNRKMNVRSSLAALRMRRRRKSNKVLVSSPFVVEIDVKVLHNHL